MLSLADLTLLLLFAAALAWLWRGHGIRERALLLTKQHCARLDIELLDGNVALRRLAVQRDARGQRRLARIYGFEFTVTGEQRLAGSISMFGQQLGRIELDAYPIATPTEAPVATQRPAANVIQLQDWKRRHDKLDL
ncbi:MAG TPA: DUF3301 domain-containing protein [Pseudomonas sp.]|nr:DUF3301 domain-containing protein [Pseudomonas sp.]